MLFEDAKNFLLENGYLPSYEGNYQYWIDVKKNGYPIHFYVEVLGGSEIVSSGFKISEENPWDSSSFSLREAVKFSRMVDSK